MVNALEGTYAFALWDARRTELLVVRDRQGEEPLFYSEDGGGLLFASELDGLVAGMGKGPGARPCFRRRILGLRIRAGPRLGPAWSEATPAGPPPPVGTPVRAGARGARRGFELRVVNPLAGEQHVPRTRVRPACAGWSAISPQAGRRGHAPRGRLCATVAGTAITGRHGE
jgi:Glutamine amidotransferase domain